MRVTSGHLPFRTPLIALVLALAAVYAASRATPAGAEFNYVYAGDCATPQSSFFLGDTVCASIGDFDLPVTSRYRRFQWVAPDGRVFDQNGVKLDPQNDQIVLPTTGDFAQYGLWTIRAIDIEAQIRTIGKFKVVNPRLKLVDLSVLKYGPALVLPGDRVKYTVTIHNVGPDDAASVSLVDAVPTNMVFYAMKQTAGRAIFDCATPARGETGETVCRSAGIADGDEVTFDIYYLVNPDTRDGVTCTGGVSVSSEMSELNKDSNFYDFEATVSTLRDTEDTGGVEDN